MTEARRRQAELLYDSARTHADVGARAGLCLDRTVLFRGPELTVDVVVHAGWEPLCCVHGQVVSQSEGRPVRGAFVRIDGGQVPVATDEHGRFALSSLSDRDGHILHIRPRDSEGELVCVIPTLAAAGDAGPPRSLRVRQGSST